MIMLMIMNTRRGSRILFKHLNAISYTRAGSEPETVEATVVTSGVLAVFATITGLIIYSEVESMTIER